MQPASRRIYVELFALSEGVHLMAALMHEDVYEEVRPFKERTVAEAEAQLSAFGSGELPGDQLHWAVRDRDTNFCLGSVQATLTSTQTLHVGYRVHTQSRNKGFATEALGLVITELTHRFPTFQVLANVHPTNHASTQVLIKSRFTAIQEQPGSISTSTEGELTWRYIKQ